MRRFLSAICILLFVTLVAGALSIPFLFLQDDPLLDAADPPSPQDVATTRQLFRDLRQAANNDQPEGSPLSVDAGQLTSALRLGAHVVKGFRGTARIDPDGVIGRASMPVPWINGRKWLNVTVSVPPFERQPTLRRVTVGRVDIPPPLALTLARWGANIVLGEGFGDKVLASATFMKIADQTLTVGIRLDDLGKNGLMRSAFTTMRGEENPDFERIDAYYVQIRDALEAGRLPTSGSFLPHLQFTLQAAFARSAPDTLRDEYTAAILALTKICGARDFAMIVGGVVFDKTADQGTWTRECREITFNDRIDSRRHFLTSAALQAASNNAVAVSVGEFKELYDTISGSGGFDFTDMAANLSGVRLSNFLMAQPFDAWPEHLARITAERDIIISFDGIPQRMPETDFKARFGDVDSPAYRAMLARIEASIDRLAFYQPL